MEDAREKQNARIAEMMEQMSLRAEESVRIQAELFSKETTRMMEQAEANRDKLEAVVAKATAGSPPEGPSVDSLPTPRWASLVIGPKDETPQRSPTAGAGSSSSGQGLGPKLATTYAGGSGGPDQPVPPIANLLAREAEENNVLRSLPRDETIDRGSNAWYGLVPRNYTNRVARDVRRRPQTGWPKYLG